MQFPRFSSKTVALFALFASTGCAEQPRKWGSSPARSAAKPTQTDVQTTNASVPAAGASPALPSTCENAACISVCERTSEADACKEAGYALRDGSGVESDFAKAALFFDRACKKKQRYGCHELAKAYSVGEGVKADPAKAVGLYGSACEMGVGQACDDLAKLHEKGDLVPQDHAKAVELLARGCAAEDYQVWTCTSLRKLVEKKDKPAAKVASEWKKACAAKDATACRNAERLTPKDAAKATKK